MMFARLFPMESHRCLAQRLGAARTWQHELHAAGSELDSGMVINPLIGIFNIAVVCVYIYILYIFTHYNASPLMVGRQYPKNYVLTECVTNPFSDTLRWVHSAEPHQG